MTVRPPRLGRRLSLIESLVPAGSRLIDVGSDHALLPITYLLHHPTAFAVAIDNKEKPLAVAEKNRRRFGLEARLDLLLADGLPAGLLTSDDCVVIAGLGGVEIKSILQRASYLPKRLVLSPHSHAEILRDALAALGLLILDEHVVLEGRRAYVVMEIEKTSAPYRLNEYERWIGPVVCQKLKAFDRTPALLLYAKRLIKHLTNREKDDPSLLTVRRELMNLIGEDHESNS